MPTGDLRAELPVLERLAYLNAGTAGPIPRRAVDAAERWARAELEDGRSGPDRREPLERMLAELRARLAQLMGCERTEVALTRSTTDGLGTVLAGLDLRRGDEVLTTDEEHAGLLAPLAAVCARAGAGVRTVPFAEVGGEVRGRTRLVACSHVSWVTGRVADAAGLAATGVPLLLDGAQGLGAVPVDVHALGCDFYAAAGQKWLCGADGSGSLFVRTDRAEDIFPTSPGYEALADPDRPLDLVLRAGARRLDRAPPGPLVAWSLAALSVLESVGWPEVHDRGRELAERLARALAERGVEVAPRGRSTLVAWTDPEPPGAVRRLRAKGLVVRDIPGHGLVRASVGAWSTEEEVERLAMLAR